MRYEGAAPLADSSESLPVQLEDDRQMPSPLHAGQYLGEPVRHTPVRPSGRGDMRLRRHVPGGPLGKAILAKVLT